MVEGEIDVQNLCGICLNSEDLLVSLDSCLDENEKDSPCIKEILQDILSTKVISCSKYLEKICSVCLEVLRPVYKLKLQFLNTENVLKNPVISEHNSAVEVIIRNKKFNLNEILSVEDVQVESQNYSGFLYNLGKTVSATYVQKDLQYESKKVFEENPIVVIEKKKKLEEHQQDYISEENLENRYTIENTQLNMNELDIANLPNQDQEISKSAVSTHLKCYICQKLYSKKLLKHLETCGNPFVPVTKGLEELKLVYISEENLEDKYTTVESIELNTNELDIANLPDQDQEISKSAVSTHLKCNICNKLYSTKCTFSKHLITCAKSRKLSLACPCCDEKFNAKKFLKCHVRKFHNIYTCEICNATLCSRNRLVYHKKTKHTQESFKCGKTLNSKNSLNVRTVKRKRRHTDTEQYLCTVCGKTYNYSGGLKYHMKSHTNDRKYCCEYCDRKFLTRSDQQRHIRTHTGERPFACKFCNKSFFSTGERRKHEYIHTGNMPFHCQYCKEGLNSKLNLHRHLTKHLGDFRCEVCGKGLISLEVLKIHCNMRHGEKKKKNTCTSSIP